MDGVHVHIYLPCICVASCLYGHLYMCVLYPPCCLKYCTHFRTDILHYTVLQGKIILLVWNISFALLVLMWALRMRLVSELTGKNGIQNTMYMYVSIGVPSISGRGERGGGGRHNEGEVRWWVAPPWEGCNRAAPLPPKQGYGGVSPAPEARTFCITKAAARRPFTDLSWECLYCLYMYNVR